MSLLLEIFTESFHKEYVLPNANNADYTLNLAAKWFGMSSDLNLEMEILDGRWRFKKTSRCKITRNGGPCMGQPISDGDVLGITWGSHYFSVIAQAQSENLGSFRKYSTYRLGELTVGKNESCDICCKANSVVSRHHATLYFSPGSAWVQDYSTNGVYVNNHRVRGQEELHFGDSVYICGLKIVYLVDTVAVNLEETGSQEHSRMAHFRQTLPERRPLAEAEQRDEQETLFHRSPRKLIPLNTEEEEIEAPPQKQNVNRKPTWMIIGPSFTMAIPMLLGCGFMILARNLSGAASSAFMYVGLITAITSAIIGVTWAIINLNYSQKEEKEAELFRLQKYGDYLMTCAARIREKYQHNRDALLETYPDAETCCGYWSSTAELWGRNRSHKDFMSYRLGIGDIPFQVPIKVPKQHFTLRQDELTDRPWEIRRNYATLAQVPINVDLFQHRVVGIIGENRESVARVLMTQIAANNCYTDIRMALLAGESAKESWGYARWFPHIWNDERSQRYIGFGKSEVSSVCYELTQLFRTRSEEVGALGARKGVLPMQYVVFVQAPDLLESEGISKYLFDQQEDIGVTTLLMARNYEDLPNSCDFVIESSNAYSGIYAMTQDGEEPQSVLFDHVSVSKAEQLARALSGIRVMETGTGSDLPETLTFFDMLGVSSLQELNVADNWKKNRTYRTMQAMVGWKSGDTPCYLDIHEKHHGPHGLVAGTTGSGKSETLQTYILSLAINYSPQDVGFFIIDFKGGGMANLFSNLPHMLGTISNLSGNQVHRAMVSIKSENVRRQRVFNSYGVNHIDAYTKLVKNNEATIPVPHLFIIIDEFAELKREEPEFMRELISVAQVGRSLGVHLILATQKPSGTVDDNIWANTKFRLCLRVADTQDSKDMLHRPDAAYLSQAGRCYLQVGNDEIYELFQAGWSGAIYDPDVGSVKNTCAVRLEYNGKAAVSGNSARARRLMARRNGWIAELVSCCARVAALQTKEPMDALFAEIRAKGFDFADNTFNRRQMTEFMTRYAPLLKLEPAAAAEIIIRDANENQRKLPEQREKTQLDAVVDHLIQEAERSGYVNQLRLWMPVLPERLLLEDVKGVQEQMLRPEDWNQAPARTTVRASVGLVDDPQNQSQFPLVLDFIRDGHLAICGSVSSGKSTLMQTIAFSLAQTHTPDMVNLYAIDYSSQMLSPVEELPHCGGVVYEGEADKLRKLFQLIGGILRDRKAKFRGGSFLQYITVHGNTEPAIFLLLDGYASFREKTENAYEGKLVELARDGAGFGIFLCISSGGFGTGELQSKIADKMRQVVCLEMESKYAYGDCLRTMHFDVMPETGVKGRGIAPCGDSILEFQAALAAEGDDYRRSETLRARSREIAALWTGRRAQPIPQIPQNPTWQMFSGTDEFRTLAADPRYLPLAYRQSDASIYSVDLSQNYCYLITGRERVGKSVFLRNVACSALAKGAEVYLVDKMGETTEKQTSMLPGIHLVNTPETLRELWKKIILTTNERNGLKKQLRNQGLEDEELFPRMSAYRPIFVLLADLADFIRACKQSTPGRAAIEATVDNIIRKGANLQVFFFGALGTQDLTAASIETIYRSFVQNKQGVHLGGELTAQKNLSYRNISYSDQGKTRKPGCGHVPDREESQNVEEIVIPMNKGLISGERAEK